MSVSLRHLCLAILIPAIVSPTSAQDDLAEYFGFEDLEIIKVGRRAGPFIVADMNGDNRLDLVIANNFASRIELHLQKPVASPDDEPRTPTRVNEFPEHWRFRRETISVTHQVNAILAHDFDGDGLMDLIYAGTPPEIVFLRQHPVGVLQVTRKHRVRNLNAHRNAFALADLVGDSSPELLSIVEGSVNIWPLDRDQLGTPIVLNAGDNLAGLAVEDFNGDGLTDLVGIIPDNSTPVRVWFCGRDGDKKIIGPEVRFEMPPIREFQPVRLPGEAAARMAIIERASKRLVVSRISEEEIESTGNRDAALRIFSFTDGENRKRDHDVVDVDGDGLLDLIATDTKANAIVVYRQVAGKGLSKGESYPSLSELNYVAARAGRKKGDGAEIFQLSEKEGVIGRSNVRDDSVPFPSPLAISAGYTPVALSLVTLESGPRVAVVAKSGRDYVLELLWVDGATTQQSTIKLGALSRSPQTIIDLDADQDGQTDLLLFTPEKPMMMLLATGSADGDEFKLLESEAMGQFGLVKEANAENTAVFDIDGDGKKELLLADKNFVRAVRFESNPSPGSSPGWQVVRQINAANASSKLVAMAILRHRIVAVDTTNDRLVIMGQRGGITADKDDDWVELESLNIQGFKFNSIYAGAFSGDGQDNILAIGDKGFAVVRLAGDRYVLEETNIWRTSEDRRVHHELETGDLNGDGLLDMIALDAAEQMCEIFTFSESGNMLHATGFKVFESRLFSGGEPREYEPSAAIVADVTGDGLSDLLLLVHDRVLLYPQMNPKSVRVGTR